MWKTIIKEYKLENDSIFLKWCAYDSDFMPNRLDTRFRDWALKGLTALCKLMKGGALLSLDTLKEKYTLEKQDFYGYLQVRHYVHLKVEKVSEASVGLIEMFRKAYNADVNGRTISCVYQGLTNLKKHSLT